MKDLDFLSIGFEIGENNYSIDASVNTPTRRDEVLHLAITASEVGSGINDASIYLNEEQAKEFFFWLAGALAKLKHHKEGKQNTKDEMEMEVSHDD